jgi:hypothetical protein
MYTYIGTDDATAVLNASIKYLVNDWINMSRDMLEDANKVYMHISMCTYT